MSKEQKIDAAKVQKCAAQHFGPWMVEPKWFSQAVNAVKAGTFKAKKIKAAGGGPMQPGKCYTVDQNGLAIISIAGQITKGESSFGGASSVMTRQAIRQAVNDDSVTAILLQIDSPGGTVAGTGDLAADVAEADTQKPCYTYFEDLGASAAYWIGSQTRAVYANPTALIGSIGTVAIVEDTSGMMDREGVKVHVVSTGPYKGAFADGAPVTDEQLADLRREVEQLNEHFLAGVASGRKMPMEAVRKVATGQVWLADEAKQLGLIDEVASLDAAVAAITNEVNRMNSDTFRQYAAEHSDSAEVKELATKGFKLGMADGIRQERERFTAIRTICGSNLPLAAEAFVAGHDADTVKLAADASAKARAEADTAARASAEAIAAKDAEIARLKEQVTFVQGSQGAVGTTGATKETGKTAPEAPVDPGEDAPREQRVDWAKAQAAYEWDNDPDVRKGFSTKDRFCNWRQRELMGTARALTKSTK